MRQLFALCAALLTAAPAIAEIKYQDSGRPWIDAGPAFYGSDAQPEDSRFLLQVWKILPSHKQVIYWTRITFTSDYFKRLKQENSQYPQWGTALDPLNPRRPMGPYLVDCNTKAVSLVLMEQSWTAPVFRPVGDDFPWANNACRQSGMPSPE